MELSILVAKLLAVFYLSIGLSVVSGKLNLNKMLSSFEESPALTLMSGFMMVVLGGLLVNYHNIWVKDWTVLVTIVSWALLIKGIMFLAFPQLITTVKGLYKNMNMQVIGFVVIALGLLFGYFGFLA